MARRFVLLLLLLLFPGIASLAQGGSAEFTFSVSTTRVWTDTGLDLRPGDLLQISASAEAASVPDRHAVQGAEQCDPKGTATAPAAVAKLAMESAPAGALIAKLHESSAAILIGAGGDVHIEEPSHLFLGVNLADVPVCQGTFLVKVRKTGGDKTEAQPKSRGEQLRTQLSTAAQIFMAGQFGTGKSEANNAGTTNATSGSAASEAPSATPALKVSDSPIDPDLGKDIDSLPRRVKDQFKNLGDMVNFVIVGSEKDVRATLEAANWHVADTNNQRAALNAVLETYEKKDYLQMPMSTLYLFGRRQDYGYEQAEPIAMVASRHHFRIWKAPFKWKDKEVWVGAGTHDIGFAKDQRNENVTHKIDPAVDGERDNIGSSLQESGKIKSLSYYLPANPVQEAKNATGDSYHSDGRLLVIFLP